MSVITTFAVDAEDFTLGAALTPNPGMRVRLERVIPVGDSFIPYLWASNETIEDIEAKLTAEADIASFQIVDETEDEALVRISWAADVDGFLRALGDARGTILEAVGESESWRFQVRFDDHADLTAFYRTCAEKGVTIEIESIHNPGVPRAFSGVSQLTEAQRETLALALQRGYFAVPRETTVVELAEELGISDSAVSQRLRRGIAAILSTSEIAQEDESEDASMSK